jgi:hypothetical protein
MNLGGILVGWAVMHESESKANHMHTHRIKVINGMLHKDLDLKKVKVWPGNPNQF